MATIYQYKMKNNSKAGEQSSNTLSTPHTAYCMYTPGHVGPKAHARGPK